MIERRIWRREFREALNIGPTWFATLQKRGVVPKGHRDPGGVREWFTETEVRETLERLKGPRAAA